MVRRKGQQLLRKHQQDSDWNHCGHLEDINRWRCNQGRNGCDLCSDILRLTQLDRFCKQLSARCASDIAECNYKDQGKLRFYRRSLPYHADLECVQPVILSFSGRNYILTDTYQIDADLEFQQTQAQVARQRGAHPDSSFALKSKTNLNLQVKLKAVLEIRSS